MKRSIHVFQRIQNEFGSASVWNSLGNLYVEQYRFDEAVRCFERAITGFGKLDHLREVGIAQFNLGLAYLELSRLKDAEKIFLRCCSVDRASGNRWFYAYDLRALAVYCILQGYPEKATRLLKKALQIFEDQNAEQDVLQSRMILLLHYLEQGSYREAAPLVSYLQEILPGLHEPMIQCEIHHLLGYYHGFINETDSALKQIRKSLALARSIRHYKLLGKNYILGLIFINRLPRSTDPDLSKAIRNFKKSKNDLECADYLLKLYQAYPQLLKQKSHARRIRSMEELYRNLRIRIKVESVRKLIRPPVSASKPDLFYEGWQEMLQTLAGRENLEKKLSLVLQKLNLELDASYGVIQYLGDTGVFERNAFPENGTHLVDDLPGKIFEQVFRKNGALFLDHFSDGELSRNRWVLLNEVRSIIAVPFFKSDQLLGFWYFERRGLEPVFSMRDRQKASVFALAASPLLETAIDREASLRKRSPVSGRSYEDMIGGSKVMLDLVRSMEKVAPLQVSVLIQGESGTGKELVARNIHRNSNRAGNAFLAVNCSAIPENLIESELFGHSRGAFTGAFAAKAGLIERAQGGTLFLDEIGDLSSAAQAKLLRVIQEKEVQRLGETTAKKIDVRFLFATHKDVRKLVQQGTYREDLFYRISGYVLLVPALRERRQDIPLLLEHFVDKYVRAFGKNNIRFASSTINSLSNYAWPGNVREMENLVQTLLVNSDSGDLIETGDLPVHVTNPQVLEKTEGLSLEEGKLEFEREFVSRALNRNQWNKTRTAKELKITRQGLLNIIERLGLEKK